MKLKITIRLDNAAFADNEAGETARILRKMADKYENAGQLSDANVRDLNGNIVGRAIITQ